jgi:hypothetical protein
MSTKTLRKRIALVAVAALGFGALSSVTVANAADHTSYVSSITVTTDKAPVAGALGTAVEHTVRFSTSTTASSTVQPTVILTSSPAGSGTAIKTTGYQTPLTAGQFQLSSVATVAAAVNAQGVDQTAATETGYSTYQTVVYLQAFYDLPGTYTYTIFDDATDNNIVNGADVSTTFSVVVGASSTTVAYVGAVTVRNASTVTTGANGSLVKINLTAAGVAAQPDSAGGIKVTLTGTAKVAAVNTVAITTPPSTYILGRNDFDGLGNAYINVTNQASEVVTLTLSGSGSVTSFTAPSAVTITTAAEVASTAAGTYVYVNQGSATGLKQTATAVSGTDGAATANKAATSVTLATGAINTTSSAYKDAVTVTDTNGGLFGEPLAKYDILVSAGASTCTTYCGTFSVATAFNTGITGQTFSASDMTGTSDPIVVTSATAVATTLSVSYPTTALRAVTGSAQSHRIKAVDQFGLVIGNAAITATIAGRNSTVNVASCITVAGYCALTYTDASTSTTSMVDTLTFANTTATSTTATVTYSSLAGLGVSTVLATTTQTSATTGADNTTIVPWAIDALSDGVEAAQKPVTITVKDANGVGIQGVPVTVTVAGAGAAITSTTQTVFTGATGIATAQVYAWLAPTYGTNYVVTATAGGVADTVNTYWGQSTAAHTRTFTATSANRVITVVAKDRFGNPVNGASFTARITAGDGFFGTGTNVATGTTDATGTMKFITLESPTDLTVVVQAGGAAGYGQTSAPAGQITSSAAADIFTATATAGTLYADEANVGGGADYTKAGINSVSVSVTGAPSATEATSQAAVDAAAEATDAANAATDAANAAAEAADAATAAAQDAADAVAALSTQVSEMVSALKKQITALTNLVIKIQKKVKA